MRDLYVVNCCRTAIGSFGGALKNTPADVYKRQVDNRTTADSNDPLAAGLGRILHDAFTHHISGFPHTILFLEDGMDF